MAFDPVHDVQRAFRKTVRAFSFPGRVVDLGPESTGQDFGIPLPSALFVVARMLLDAETTFYCQDDSLAGVLEMLTFARRAPIDRADFIIVDGRCRELTEALATAKCGTLTDPHESATIIALASFGEELEEWRLAGPGIDGERRCRFSLAAGWDRARAERNREFPLGVDLVLISNDNRLAVLPRTTRISAEVA